MLAGASEEDYREVLARLRGLVLDKGLEAFNYDLFSGGEAQAEEVMGAVRTRAMGSGGRLVVLRQPRGMPPSGRETIAAYLRRPEKGNCLLVVLDEDDRDSRIFKEALAAGCLVDFGLARGEGKVTEELAALGLKAEPEALAMLESALPDDRGLRRRELEKVALAAGEGKTVRAADLADLLVGRGADGGWALINFLERRDMPRALRELDKLLEEGEPPLAIVGALAAKYRQLWQMKTAQAMGLEPARFKELKSLPAFVLQGLSRSAGRFTLDEVEAAIISLERADRLLKSTPLPPAFVMESCLAGWLAAPED